MAGSDRKHSPCRDDFAAHNVGSLQASTNQLFDEQEVRLFGIGNIGQHQTSLTFITYSTPFVVYTQLPPSFWCVSVVVRVPPVD